MATLRQYYDTDFSRNSMVGEDFALKSDDVVSIHVQIHHDFDANVKFLSCYLPSTPAPAEIFVAAVKSVDRFLKIGSGATSLFRSWTGRYMSCSDLVFSGRFFLYGEDELSESDLDRIYEAGRPIGVFPYFRGPQFVAERNRVELPMAFISHDSRDKDNIARPLAIELVRTMCPVWYDEFSLKIGDSLRESIEKGLKECKKCILIVSPNFLANRGWTKTEFNSIFTRELIEGENVVLPIWCGIEKKDVYEYCPVLVDRLARHWNIGVKAIANEIRGILLKP